MSESRGRRAVAIAMAVVLAVLMMKDASLAAEAVRRGLLLCARTMIPSLFPFMVVAELIVRSGAGRWISRLGGWLLQPLFGIGEAGCVSVTLGALCGFPVGARTAASYYRRGQMSAEEFERVICFCNLPSAAYLMGAVGLSLFGSVRVGRALLGLSFGSAVLVGLVLRLGRRTDCLRDTVTVPCDACEERASLLSDAIRAAADGMTGICATVLLFSAVGAVVGRYLSAFSASPLWRAILAGFLELSTGAEAAAGCEGNAGLLLCAATVGWGGLSVHCQILSACADCPRVAWRFWLSRLVQAALCAAGMWGLIALGAVGRETVDHVTHAVLVGGQAGRGSIASGVWCMVWVGVVVAVSISRGIRAWRGRYVKKTQM